MLWLDADSVRYMMGGAQPALLQHSDLIGGRRVPRICKDIGRS